MKVAITGASGFVGSHVRRLFPDHVIIDRSDGVDAIVQKIKGVDTVINLAGAPIIKRWTSAYRKELWDSRIRTTERLVQAIEKSRVGYFISTSAVGIYPDDTVCDELCSLKADDFLAKLATEWEVQALKCSRPTAVLRFGMVLGRNGGALAQMIPVFRLCLGGPIGRGQMITSWIDIDDLMGIYQFLIQGKGSGIYNAVSPNPVTNYQFSRELSRIYGCPIMLPVPKLIIRLLYGEAARVILASKHVLPARLLSEGFSFRYPEISGSFRHLLQNVS